MDYISSRLDFQINRLGYKFQDVDLLTEALTHSVDKEKSDVNFPRKNKSKDSLAAIGNSVLKLLAAQYAIQTSGVDADQGALTTKKEELIDFDEVQKSIGRRLILVDSNGKENADNIHECVRILTLSWNSNVFEPPYDQFFKAILGAVFIDAGGTSGDGIQKAMNVYLKLRKWSKVPVIGGEDNVKELKSCFPVPNGIKILWQLSNINESYTSKLESLLDFEFDNTDLLCEALIQRSFYDPERENLLKNRLHEPHYQRLEFLGDSVLEVAIMEFMFHNYPSYGKGLDNKTKPYIANEYLHGLALKLRLDKFLQAKPNFLKDGWNAYNDLMESVIGAMYVDGGFDETSTFILKICGLSSLTNVLHEKLSFEDLEYKLGYKFDDLKLLEVAMTHDSARNSEDSKMEFRNDVKLGRSLVMFYSGDYVIRTCKTNAKPGALEAHLSYLCGESLVRSIAYYLQLNELAKMSRNMLEGKTKFCRYEKFVFAIFGFIFNKKGLEAMNSILKIFYRLWNPYLKHCPKLKLKECFPLSPAGQNQLRIELLGYKIPEEDFKEIEANIGGHQFKHRCLLEQALTERESRSYTTDINVGDSTKFEFVGKCVVQFLKSWNSLKHPDLHKWMSVNGFEPETAWRDSFNYKLLRKHYVQGVYITPKNDSLFHGVIGAIFVDAPGEWMDNHINVTLSYIHCINRYKIDYESRSKNTKENHNITKPSIAGVNVAPTHKGNTIVFKTLESRATLERVPNIARPIKEIETINSKPVPLKLNPPQVNYIEKNDMRSTQLSNIVRVPPQPQRQPSLRLTKFDKDVTPEVNTFMPTTMPKSKTSNYTDSNNTNVPTCESRLNIHSNTDSYYGTPCSPVVCIPNVKASTMKVLPKPNQVPEPPRFTPECHLNSEEYVFASIMHEIQMLKYINHIRQLQSEITTSSSKPQCESTSSSVPSSTRSFESSRRINTESSHSSNRLPNYYDISSSESNRNVSSPFSSTPKIPSPSLVSFNLNSSGRITNDRNSYVPGKQTGYSTPTNNNGLLKSQAGPSVSQSKTRPPEPKPQGHTTTTPFAALSSGTSQLRSASYGKNEVGSSQQGVRNTGPGYSDSSTANISSLSSTTYPLSNSKVIHNSNTNAPASSNTAAYSQRTPEVKPISWDSYYNNFQTTEAARRRELESISSASARNSYSNYTASGWKPVTNTYTSSPQHSSQMKSRQPSSSSSPSNISCSNINNRPQSGNRFIGCVCSVLAFLFKVWIVFILFVLVVSVFFEPPKNM